MSVVGPQGGSAEWHGSAKKQGLVEDHGGLPVTGSDAGLTVWALTSTGHCTMESPTHPVPFCSWLFLFLLLCGTARSWGAASEAKTWFLPDIRPSKV